MYVRGGVLRLSDLADIKIASLVRGRPVRDITEKYVKQAGARLNISFETDSPVTLRRIISQGMAPAFFPEKTWELDDYSAVEFRRFDPPCAGPYMSDGTGPITRDLLPCCFMSS